MGDDVADGALTELFREKLKKEKLMAKLVELKYDPNPRSKSSTVTSDDDDGQSNEVPLADSHGYDYLTGMPIYSFTEEERIKLALELDKVSDEIKILDKKSEMDM